MRKQRCLQRISSGSGGGGGVGEGAPFLPSQESILREILRPSQAEAIGSAILSHPTGFWLLMLMSVELMSCGPTVPRGVGAGTCLSAACGGNLRVQPAALAAEPVVAESGEGAPLDRERRGSGRASPPGAHQPEQGAARSDMSHAKRVVALLAPPIFRKGVPCGASLARGSSRTKSGLSIAAEGDVSPAYACKGLCSRRPARMPGQRETCGRSGLPGSNPVSSLRDATMLLPHVPRAPGTLRSSLRVMS